MGNPNYKITGGDIRFKGESLLGTLAADERARKGLFLAFQYPVAIPGVTLVNFLRQAAERPPGHRSPDARIPRVALRQDGRC
jgi:Fe-S cluster assembly ATP-binding protein